MKITIREQGNGLERFANAIRALGDQAPVALGRALRHTGDKSKTQVVRSLARQTGLSRSVIVRAVKVKGPRHGNPNIGRADADLTYTLESRGGDISLKYFGAREVRAGVTAKPWNVRKTYKGAFMRGGAWPNRVALPTLNGHAFRRTDTDRTPIEKQKSGVVIPEEMIEGATLEAFETVINRDLPARVGHELHRLLQAHGF